MPLDRRQNFLRDPALEGFCCRLLGPQSERVEARFVDVHLVRLLIGKGVATPLVSSKYVFLSSGSTCLCKASRAFSYSKLKATSLPLNHGTCSATMGERLQASFVNGWISIMGLRLEGDTIAKVGLLSLKTARLTNRWHAPQLHLYGCACIRLVLTVACEYLCTCS